MYNKFKYKSFNSTQEWALTHDDLIKHNDLCLTINEPKAGQSLILDPCQNNELQVSINNVCFFFSFYLKQIQWLHFQCCIVSWCQFLAAKSRLNKWQLPNLQLPDNSFFLIILRLSRLGKIKLGLFTL